MKKLIFILLFPVQLVFGQATVTLDSCYQWTRENYPNLQQTGILREITSLKQENIKTGFLPQVTLNGQATYQSDVTKVNISMPGLTIPTVSKDQYKAYAEFRQTIWDGGLIAANSKLEEAVLQSNLSQLEVELYKLNDQVAQAFFTALAVEKQIDVLKAQKKVIQEKLQMVYSGIKNQVLEKSAAFVLEAEILNIDQNQLQLNAGKRAAFKMLSILTGKKLPENTKLSFIEPSFSISDLINRPEQDLFSTQKKFIEMQNDLLEKSRNPKVFGFGQLGYGKPALNMLNNKFDDYYLVGVGISWNAFDWKKTSRQKQVLLLNQKLITQQEETFNQNIQLLLAQQSEQIDKLKNMIGNDSKLVILRTEIANISGSKLKNGTITSSDYVQDVQAETVARLNSELHKIQLNEANVKYSLIKGNTENQSVK